MKADSTKDAAGKCVGKMHRPSSLGRRLDQRITKMAATIETAIGFGFVTFGERKGVLKLTRKGRQALERQRGRYVPNKSRRHGKRRAYA